MRGRTIFAGDSSLVPTQFTCTELQSDCVAMIVPVRRMMQHVSPHPSKAVPTDHFNRASDQSPKTNLPITTMAA